MSMEIRVPLTEIQVKFRVGNRRPITELDRMVMQAITTGANSVAKLKLVFQLPERLLVECLVDLMDMALLALEASGDGFQLTKFGTRSLEEKLTDFGENLDNVEEETFLREDMTGRIGSRFWYDQEKASVVSLHGMGNIPRGEIGELLRQKLKYDRNRKNQHLHSVESIIPVRDGISFKVTVNEGGCSGLPDYWNHLKPLLMAEAEKHTGKCYAVPQRIDEDKTDGPDWTEVCLSEDNLLLTASDHETQLLEAIGQAHRHVLILSAHVSETMLSKLKYPIQAAVERGVRVDILIGLSSLNEGEKLHAKTLERWSKDIKKSSSNGAGNYLTINQEPLDSDAKILVWDARDDDYRAIVGSYNWLYGFDDSGAESRGTEVSIRIDNPRLISNICATVSGWLDDAGQRMNGISLRWNQIGESLSQQNLPNSRQSSAMVRARVLYDGIHDDMLREGLLYARQRLLVVSHKINRSATGNAAHGKGKLDWLERREQNPAFQFVLVSGKNPNANYWTEGDQDRLETLVDQVNGSICLGTGTHARVLIHDNQVVVSSHNFLSAAHDRRQIGIILKSPAVADVVWETFRSFTSTQCRA